VPLNFCPVCGKTIPAGSDLNDGGNLWPIRAAMF
jgi:hypothetical protein